MAKTALDLTAEEWDLYQPARLGAETASAERWERAWETARHVARLLRERFGATRVVVFGSLARRDWFTRWSDIDLAAWGIPGEQFYQAVAAVTGVSGEFKVDLVDPELCRPAVRERIAHEDVEL